MKKKYLIYIAICIASLAFVCGALYITVINGHLRLNYPSYTDYPVQGIDVSHHQQKIRWDMIDKNIVQFAFIKATEGGDHRDSTYQENWREAIRNHIPVAAYHFFTFCKEGDAQARNYIHYVPRDSMNLPPIIDIEYGGNCKEPNRKQDLVGEITKYLDIVEDHYQRKVIIYTTNEFYKHNLQNHFLDNPIWIRDIVSEPKLPDGRNWLFWQYTNLGKIEGVDTQVDLNAFNGSKEDFEKLIIKPYTNSHN